MVITIITYIIITINGRKSAVYTQASLIITLTCVLPHYSIVNNE